MKRFFLFLTFVSCFLLAGCAPSPAEETADNFFVCLENGYPETAMNYASEEMKEELSGYLSTGEDTDELIRSVISHAFSEHEIIYAKRINENKYELTVRARMLDHDEISKLTGSLDITSFYRSISEEAKALNEEQGEEAAQAFIKEKTADYIQSYLEAYFTEYEYPERQMKITVENLDTWVITDISSE